MNFGPRTFRYLYLSAILGFCLSFVRVATAEIQDHGFQIPQINLEPHRYVVYKTATPLTIDGKLSERTWQEVRWTTNFVNITSSTNRSPKQQTRVKLLWSDTYLYVGIQALEKHVWATATTHDAPLFLTNLCELFIDPDGDTQEYIELGVNALGTTYDLLLTRPYRDGGRSIGAYNIHGLKVGVSVDGTINDPKRIDTGWTAEIAIPMKALRELNLLGEQKPPVPGDQWRVQFARAEHQLSIVGGQYSLKKNPKTNRPLPAAYSSWSPEGLVNLHYPEMWGFIQFSGIVAGHDSANFEVYKYERIKSLLRHVYYREKRYYSSDGSYTDSISELNAHDSPKQKLSAALQVHATRWTFLATLPGTEKGSVWLINQDGKIWRERR